MFSLFKSKEKNARSFVCCPDCEKLKEEIIILRRRHKHQLESLQAGKILCANCQFDEVAQRGDWCRLCIACMDNCC